MSIWLEVLLGSLGYIALVGGLMCLFKRRPTEDHNEVLKRCRRSLWSIRHELESLPAGREVHLLHDEMDRTERTINRVEAEVK